MKPSTNDQIKGKLHEVKGDVKEKAGQVRVVRNLSGCLFDFTFHVM